MKRYLLFSVFLIALFSCKKDIIPDPPVITKIQGIDLSIGYKVDNKSLIIDSLIYQTQAGYAYSVSKLVYFLSGISLIRPDSTRILLKDYQYIDAADPLTNHFMLDKIPGGNYIGLCFNIGLDSLHNRIDALSSSAENNNMQWPEAMGGGYHFVRIEGYYKDSSGSYGYAMHVGTNACLVPIKIYSPVIILADTKTPVTMVMNINEWFRNPNTYDFNKDGNYIMGNVLLMKKFAENGTDVFNF